MNALQFLLFLLLINIASSRGSDLRKIKDCNRRLLQARSKSSREKTITAWKPEKSHVRCLPKASSQHSASTPDKPQSEAFLNNNSDNPEEWFVKIYHKPDTAPPKYILCSLVEDRDEPCCSCHGDSLTLLPCDTSKDLAQDCVKCRMQNVDGRLVLRCTGCKSSSECDLGKLLQLESKVIMLHAKFLQISETNKTKTSTLRSLIEEDKSQRERNTFTNKNK